MKDRPQGAKLSRRRFVTMVAAGSAAVIANPLAAATGAAPARRTPIGKPPMKPKVPAAPVAPVPAPGTELGELDRKELERQKQSTLDTLATIRKHAMPAGTELGFVFRPLKPSRKGR